jgi:4-amino-4-deoxychorismate lyase
MSLLLETIKIQDSEYQNLEYHNARMNRSRKILLSCTEHIDLQEVLPKLKLTKDQIYKCRILYDYKINKIDIQSYRLKIVRSLKVIESSTIDYSHKFADRQMIEDLKRNVEEDDILIVKNGYITDTSYANIIFREGEQWITPATPLLRGTKREKLLRENKIIEQIITVSDLKKYSEARLINAMLDIENSVPIPIMNII